MDEQTQNFEITFKPRHQAFACAYASGACGAAAHGSALVTGHEAFFWTPWSLRRTPCWAVNKTGRFR